MKILFAAMPVAGHLNLVLTIARMAMERGDEAIVTTGSYLRSAVDKAGARFIPPAPVADIDLSRIERAFPDVHALPPGPEKLRRLYEHGIDVMPALAATLRAVMAEERPDIVVSDGAFLGRTALFLDPGRPPTPLVSCGFTHMGLDRADGAPIRLGLPPARDDAERARYRALAAEIDAVFTAPLRAYADAKLAEMGLPPLPCSLMAAFVLTADAYLHPTVPAFEYDFGELPAHVRFVGALPPPPPRGGPLPDWWGDLDGGRRAVLVTQGTLANADLGELVEPALEALAGRDDLLVIVTTGGRAVDAIRGPVPANARLAEYLDYAQLLPKLSAVVTNGGYGTVQLALRTGVPIVAAGRTEDKAEVGARVAWSRVGIEIPKQRPEVEDLRAAVDRVLSEPSYRARARAIAADMAAIDTRAEILGVLDALVRGGFPKPAPA